MNTKYNVLFNGENSFLIGKEILSKTYEDNFYEILPIEPISINGENINETTIIPGFSKAEDTQQICFNRPMIFTIFSEIMLKIKYDVNLSNPKAETAYTSSISCSMSYVIGCACDRG